MTKLIGPFRNFANAPENDCWLHCGYPFVCPHGTMRRPQEVLRNFIFFNFAEICSNIQILVKTEQK